ncbi:hotdog family protein [Rheinheimera sp. MMS21-TC3]|uniref:hotdog family protein n=1 Tax=Rheinheimera sp. MMS21-TC3 TaxID=3072790 RepID=UPI0028C38C19|nr:hotdog family protein [Rheinheimera sp. MMS21-TC3]WNO59544.1 hotdog family protein [Rheinheimera sp. MMS21-TC3]
MITGYSIEQVLPHRAPMILLDNFIEAGADYGICQVAISESSPFYDPASNAVPAYVGIEYMAQTIAAYAGANRLKAGGQVKIGFLLGCRKYQPQVTEFIAGTELTVRATELVRESSGLSVFECSISSQEQLLVSARLNVFEPEDYQEWLTE